MSDAGYSDRKSSIDSESINGALPYLYEPEAEQNDEDNVELVEYLNDDRLQNKNWYIMCITILYKIIRY